MSVNWLPLESNPEVLNTYVSGLEFDTNEFGFSDLYSTEDWAKGMINAPVLGVLLVFPYNDTNREFRKIEEAEVTEKGQFVDPELFFMKQKAPNACGTIGIFHLLTNLPDEQKHLLKDTSLVTKFKKENIATDVEARADNFNKNADILSAHRDAVEKGDTNVIEEVNNHFVAFVNFKNTLYELDGTKKFPINHGPTSAGSFLDDVCQVINKFMKRDPENIGFGIVVLSKN